MRCHTIVALAGILVAPPLAAQENPFAFTGGSVKSAYIVYDMTNKQKQGAGGSYELGVTPDRWIARMVIPFDMAGKKDTMRTLVVTTRDSQYTYNAMGSQPGEGEVSPTLRPHLAKAYAALDATAKARFKQNLKLATESSSFGSAGDTDAMIALLGDKTGSETIGGHKCEGYKRGKQTACVLPGAPMVFLRWTDEKQGMNMVAKKITLNGPVPTASSLLPKGVRWQKKEYDDADYVLGIWSMKKQTDPATTPAATLAQFAVRYLASPGANAELLEMGGGMGEGDEPPAEDGGDDEAGS